MIRQYTTLVYEFPHKSNDNKKGYALKSLFYLIFIWPKANTQMSQHHIVFVFFFYLRGYSMQWFLDYSAE